MIYILTGPVRTGKTTALFHWTSGRQDTDGLLCPDDSDGKRYFFQLALQQQLRLEATDLTESSDIITIGRFHFLKSAFTAANAYLIEAAGKECRYLVIDEIGKLELENQGLHPAAETLITQRQFHEKLHVILVVRDTLITEVLMHYTIKFFRLITGQKLTTLR
ncbi:MAG: hypothetical protein KDD04_08770 [Sinomicrobium sp.]|nr:hypothetical protein [Sinomicrobium sp.]